MILKIILFMLKLYTDKFTFPPTLAQRTLKSRVSILLDAQEVTSRRQLQRAEARNTCFFHPFKSINIESRAIDIPS